MDEPSVPASPAPRVVVADDHPGYREGVAAFLQENGIEVVRVVASGEAALRAVEETLPDVVVMDLRMPGMSGLEATRRLAEAAPRSRVLVLSVSADAGDVTDAMLAGASAYVLKDDPVSEVITAILAAAGGHTVISRRVATLLLRRATAEGTSVLSEHELKVLERLAEGQTSDEIAEALATRHSAVRLHVTSILTKLQVDDRVRAAVTARDLNLN